jgi:hypothetical protein
MNKIQRSILIGTVMFAAAGCGGSDNSNSVLPSLYEGTWIGTWTGPLANDGGSLGFTVSADGSMTGSMSRSGGSISGPISGVISNSGRLTATTGFPTSGNFIIGGQVVLGNGTLSGSFTYSWLGNQYQGSFSETLQSTTGS